MIFVYYLYILNYLQKTDFNFGPHWFLPKIFCKKNKIFLLIHYLQLKTTQKLIKNLKKIKRIKNI